MTKSPNYCLETDRQVNHCFGCENCCSQLSENKMPDILSMMGLYAAEAKTYYLYYQSWFHLEDSKK